MKNTIKTIAVFALFAATVACNTTPENKTIAQKTMPTLVVEKDSAASTYPAYVYVTAPSGLSLRAYENLDSEKLAIMPYGTKVKVLAAQKNVTMNVTGIKGGMHKVEYNNKKGFAFNGYLSTLFPPEKNANAQQYIEDLKATHPAASYSKQVGGTASKPSETVLVTLPTQKWHEGFFIAQRLFNVPATFAFPNLEGRDIETLTNATKPAFLWVSELKVTRANNHLQSITYTQESEGYRSQVTLTKEGDVIKIESNTAIE